METIQISTRGKQAFHDITSQVQDVVSGTGVEDGVCFVFCPHTTAGVTFNENWDSSVQHDLGVGLDEISPARPEYRHGEGNSPAHLKSSLVGAAQSLLVEQGQLLLGRWQGLFLVEFDGPRTRQVHVKVVAG